MSEGRSLHILLSAYSCEPGAGSEPGVGWNLATALAKNHDVWVLTRANNRSVIEDALVDRPVPRLRFAYYDLPARLRWWKRGPRGTRAYYHVWQAGALGVAGQLAADVAFDVAQHVTFVQYWSPSFLSRMSIPYVWGPVGGAERVPRSLQPAISWRGKAQNALRAVLNTAGDRALPGVARTARNSSVALASTPETAARLVKLGAPSVRVMSAVALSGADLELIDGLPDAPQGTPFTFVTATRLIGTKCVALGLRAFARAQLPDARFVVIGDGADRSYLQRLAASEGVGERVRFTGRLPRREVLARLKGADALVHLSPAESGGFICLEAMAAGVPVLHLDAGGPRVVVPESAGIRVSVDGLTEVVESIADAMRRLRLDEGLRRRLGACGRDHARARGTWESRVSEIERVYEEVVAGRVSM